ncbi:MAG: hypothetical protein ACREBU_22355, partial [Nitrososphaera sp.]
LLEYDTEGITKTFKLQADLGLSYSGFSPDIETFSALSHGQAIRAFALTTPGIYSLFRILPTGSVAWRLFRVSYIFDDAPENAAIPTPYDDAGYPGAKFVQGAIIDALGISPVAVQFDNDLQGASLSLNHVPGSVNFPKPYSFTPFIAHRMRLKPTLAIRLAPKVTWVWEPSPELTEVWITQGTNHDIPGWQFLKDGYIALASSDIVTLKINVDGTDFSYAIPSTGGVYKKVYLIFSIDLALGKCLKGKLFTYSLTSNLGFRLFQKDCEVRVHPWSGGNYVTKNPFGDVHRVGGARI